MYVGFSEGSAAIATKHVTPNRAAFAESHIHPSARPFYHIRFA
jgi:hypothetical protein